MSFAAHAESLDFSEEYDILAATWMIKNPGHLLIDK